MPLINVTPDDLTKLRFAYRPLVELAVSYQVFRNPDFQWPHRRWVEDARRGLHDVELPYLDTLIPPRGFLPDFLTPTPLRRGSSIEDDLEGVLATPDWLIRKNILLLMQDVPDSEILHFFLAHPREAVHCLVEELRVYWRRAMDEAWPRMVSVLEGDILYRGKLLALDGPGALLGDLHDTITPRPGALEVTPTINHAHCPSSVALEGSGIQLVPSIFTGSGRFVQVSPEYHPMVGYSARGVGLYMTNTRASQPLELALGARRAQVLIGLRTPASTGELAHALQLTSGAVSQQLGRLYRAGLVEPRRSGRWVYYHLTERGENLIALFDQIT